MALKQDFKSIEEILNNKVYKNDVLELKSIIYGYDISSCSILEETIFLANRCSLTDPTPHLIALDSKTLKEKWKFNYEYAEAGTGNIISKNGLLYFGDEKQVHIIDAKTGEEKWKFDYNYPYKKESTVGVGKIALNNGVLYLADYKQVCAIDLETKVINWKFPSEDAEDFNVFPYYEQLRPPMVYNNQIYFAFENGKIYCLNSNNGKEVWKYIIPDKNIKLEVIAGNSIVPIECFTTPISPISHNKMIIFGDKKEVHALDKDTGEKKWAFPTKDDRKIEIYGKDENIFLSDGYGVHILNSKNGKEESRIPYEGWVDCMHADADNFYICFKNMLYVLDLANLKENLKFSLDSTIFNIHNKNNQLYIETCNNNLYIFDKKC